MNIKSIKDADLKHKIVILRADFNVPLSDGGIIEDDTRIKQTLPTIKYILDQESKLIIISHLGRPKGEIKEKLRLKPVGERLAKLLDTKIQILDKCRGPKVKEATSKLKSKEILLLENIRFEKGEKNNDDDLAKELADLADIYINDAFATCHRSHASIIGIPKYIPGYAGLLVEKEIYSLNKAMKEAERPITLILGGVKVDTKIGIINNYLGKAESILLGGALANTFLAARGFEMGESKYEEDKIDLARDIMLEAEKLNTYIYLPRDVIVATEISEEALKLDLPLENVESDMKILDIGKVTIKRFCELIGTSKTIIWNGPLGVHEFNRFSHGSKRIAESIIKTSATTIVGGGDTIDFLKRYKYGLDKFTHVSTAGGAMIEFLEGKSLPGIKVLQK